MSFAEHQTWLELLATGNETGLAKVAAEVGFGEPVRTAANLCLLHETLADPRLIIALTRHALTTADPDMALNNLERLSTRVDKSDLTIVLIDETSTRQLLIVLGASPFLTGILCRRASFFAGLFRKGQINQSKTEPQMYAELRQMIGDDADTAKIRRWDSVGAQAVTVPVDKDGWILLEDGVQIKFKAGTYRTGDYWLIPARLQFIRNTDPI